MTRHFDNFEKCAPGIQSTARGCLCYHLQNLNKHSHFSGSLSYTAGIFYVYQQKMEGLTITRKLPRRLAGTLVGLTVSGVGIGSAYLFNKLVVKPLDSKELACSSCSLTRGAGVSSGFTGAGMLGVTSIYAYHFHPQMGPISLSVHSFNFLSKSVYGCLFLIMGGLTGLALARQLNIKNGLQ